MFLPDLGLRVTAWKENAEDLIRNWEAAQKVVRDWEARIEGGSLAVRDALDRFMADCVARGLGQAQIGKYMGCSNVKCWNGLALSRWIRSR
jgi:hypothetical protein